MCPVERYTISSDIEYRQQFVKRLEPRYEGDSSDKRLLELVYNERTIWSRKGTTRKSVAEQFVLRKWFDPCFRW